jgi:phage terminase large subunit-like protein
MALNRKNMGTYQWKQQRLRVLKRDGYVCAYCGNEATAVDHVVPAVKGGDDSLDNLVASCKPCNSRKGSSSVFLGHTSTPSAFPDNLRVKDIKDNPDKSDISPEKSETVEDLAEPIPIKMGTKNKKPLIGKTKPRISSPPLTGNSYGEEFAAFAEKCGYPLLPWQKYVATDFLTYDDEKMFIRKTVGILVSRQQGKTFLAALRILFGLFVLDEMNIVAMSSNRSMALDTFRRCVSIIEKNEFLRDQVLLNRGTVGKFGSGNECIELKNGARYEIVAATRDGARGKSADLLFIDELREISEEAWRAAKPTTRARANSQTILVSNAGDAFSTVLNDLRDRALSYPAKSLGWYEYSAPQHAKLTDRDAWASSNPALGYTVTEAAIEEALSTDTPETFRTETLCQWISSLSSPWPIGVFEDLGDTSLVLGPGPSTFFAFDIAQSRRTASLVIGQMTPNGEKIAVRILDSWKSSVSLDELKIAADIKAHCDIYMPRQVCFDHYATATIAKRLEISGVKMVDVSGQQFYQASMDLLDAMVAGRLVHDGDLNLINQMNACAAKTNEASWRIVRRQSAGDISAPISLAMLVNQMNLPPSVAMIYAG